MKNPYLLDADNEQALFYASSLAGLLSSVAGTNTEKPHSPEEKKSLLAAAKIATGLLGFETREKLLEEWKDINWSENPQFAAMAIFLSGNPDAYKACRVDWLNIKNSSYREDGRRSSRHHDLNEEKLWLVGTLMRRDVHPFFSNATSGSSKFSMAPLRAQEVFWKEMLDSKKITVETELESVLFYSPEKLRVYDLAICYDCEAFLSKNPPGKSIQTPEQAAMTLFCVLNGATGNSPVDPKLRKKIVAACIKQTPDLGLLVHEKKLTFSSALDGTGAVKTSLSGVVLHHALKEKNDTLLGYLESWLVTASQSAKKDFAETLALRPPEVAQRFLPFVQSLPAAEQKTIIQKSVIHSLGLPSCPIAPMLDLLKACDKVDASFSRQDLVNFMKYFWQNAQKPEKINQAPFKSDEMQSLIRKTFDSDVRDSLEQVFNFFKKDMSFGGRVRGLAEKSLHEKRSLEFDILLGDVKDGRTRPSSQPPKI